MQDKPQTALLKFGHVAEIVDAGHVRVRFADLDNLVSHPFKVVVARAHKDKETVPPHVGAFVVCICDENLEEGAVLGECYHDNNRPPVDNAALWHWTMFDGSVFQFDRDSGALIVKTTGPVHLESAGSVTVKAGNGITLDASTTTVTGHLNVQNGISIRGNGGGGSTAVFTGDILIEGHVDVDGHINATGTIMDVAGNSANHVHGTSD